MKVQLAILLMAANANAESSAPVVATLPAKVDISLSKKEPNSENDVTQAILVLDRAGALTKAADNKITIKPSVVDALRASGSLKDRQAKTGVMCGE